jgi:hypothetical protein
MNRTELLRHARVGAAARLVNLQREIETIYQTFPDLRPGRSAQAQNPYTAGVRSAVAGVREAVEGAVRRRRPNLSREARKRISEAQNARWATHRSEKAAGEPVGPKTSRGKGSRKKK